MFVIGTAGHVDHGKSVLIQKLTGIDPDRLREEKERGMTIDLGFAWLKLPGGEEVGIVDVPGHERFIKNMLAGVGGIDLALLVISANEGVMQQTREHLAIINLLRIDRGIVVITKIDLVDEEILTLVNMEAEDLIKPTSLAGAPILAVSALTGEGLPLLIETIDKLLQSAEPRKDLKRPRLFIDRAFTITGSGTVVTGTLIDGSLSQAHEVDIVPSGHKARIRTLQTHKTRIETATPGSRVAANIVGVSPAQIERGDVLTSQGWLIPTRRIDARLEMLPDISHPLRHGATITFFVGSSEVDAKVHLLESKELNAGESSLVQFALSHPVAVVKGDHFIIRSPNDTLGGGLVVNSNALRHKRFHEDTIKNLEIMEKGQTEEVILTALEIKQPLALENLVVQCNLNLDEALQAVKKLVEQKKIMGIGQGDQILVTMAEWERLVKKAEALVSDYHSKFATRQGMPKGELNSKLSLPTNSPVFNQLFLKGVLLEEGSVVRLPSHQIELTKAQQEKVDKFLASLKSNPYSPPGDITVEPDLLNLLLEQQKVVKVADGIVFSRDTYDEMVDKIVTRAREQGKITLAEVRDMFSTSRKYAMALLEYMDAKKITRRVGDDRIAR
jgi:selenocysteine-specific elongation factor